MNYFFRGVEDGWKFHSYGTTHIAIIFFIIFGIYLILRHRERISDGKCATLKYSLCAILIANEILKIFWLTYSGRFDAASDLPLYHCRISVIAAILAFLTDKNFFKIIAVYWGFLGGVLAIAVPDLYSFKPPHFTNFSFFFSHISLLFSALIFSLDKKFDFNSKSLFIADVSALALSASAAVINVAVKGNYAYTRRLPVSEGLANLPGVLGTLVIALAGPLISNFIVYKIGSYMRNKNRTMN